MRTLVYLHDFGSLAEAAKRLHLTPAAVHRQLKTLQLGLGITLYEKVGRGVRLTRAAELLLPYCRDLLAQHDAAVLAVDEWKGLRRGVVRVGAGPTICCYILPELLKRFRRLHPQIDLVVESGNSIVLLEALRDGALDAALLVSSPLPEDPALQVEAWWEVEYVLVSNLRHAPAHCPIAALGKFPFVLYKRGSRIAHLVDHYLAEVGFQPKVTMTFDNADAIKAMIRAGFGVSMLPYWVVHADLKNRGLRMIHQQERPLLSRIELLTRRASYVPGPVSAFAEVARTFQCRQPPLKSRANGTI